MQNRFLVRERIESELAVISTHAAATDASEWQRIQGNVQNNVVDRDAAAGGRRQGMIDEFLIPSEQIHCQWFWTFANEVQSLKINRNCN